MSGGSFVVPLGLMDRIDGVCDRMARSMVCFLRRDLLSSCTSRVNCSGCRLSHVFGRRAKLAVDRCVQGQELTATTVCLLRSSRSVVRVTFGLRFRSRRTFAHSFGRLCGVPPKGCHGRVQALRKVRRGGVDSFRTVGN